MFCIKCGVHLADTEKHCPLCSTRVYHPDITLPDPPPLFPQNSQPKKPRRSKGPAVFFTATVLLAIFTTLLCDLQLHRAITWSGYVIGALVLFYTALVLPLWFRSANPVIFLPCSFFSASLYLLYIALVTGGNWFFSFALPVTAGIALIFTALAALLRYVHRGRLYIFGSCFLALGGFMPLVESLLSITFDNPFIGWSVFPAAPLILLGGFLIFLGICRPAREAMTRKFFF